MQKSLQNAQLLNLIQRCRTVIIIIIVMFLAKTQLLHCELWRYIVYSSLRWIIVPTETPLTLQSLFLLPLFGFEHTHLKCTLVVCITTIVNGFWSGGWLTNRSSSINHILRFRVTYLKFTPPLFYVRFFLFFSSLFILGCKSKESFQVQNDISMSPTRYSLTPSTHPSCLRNYIINNRLFMYCERDA